MKSSIDFKPQILKPPFCKTIGTSEWLRLNDFNTKDIRGLMCIYKIISPSNKIYVGKTINLYERIKGYVTHFNAGRSEQKKLYRSFLKYGIGNHKIKLIEIVYDVTLLDNKEIHYINFYKSFDNKIGLNITKGGGGCLGRKMTEDNKQKLIKANRERVHTKDTRLRLSLARKGRPSNRKGVVLSAEARAKMSLTKKALNIKITDWHKERIAQAGRGRVVPVEQRERMSKAIKEAFKTRPLDYCKKFCKPILQFTLRGDFIREITRTELRLEGFSVEAIKRCLNNKSKSSQGFLWMYKKI